MLKIGDRVKYVGTYWIELKYHPGTVKSLISTSFDEEDLVDVLYDGEDNTRRTYVKSLEKL
jgi:hypothetical protein